MIDIVERLRIRNGRADGFGLGQVCDEAADEIECLRANLAAMCANFDAMREEKNRWKSLAAPPVAPGWQPIETAPQTGRKIILSYINSNGKARTVMARWVTDEEAAETDADDVGLEGGWYECINNWDDYSQVAIHEGEPTHWMPLPAAPGAPDAPTTQSHPQR